MLNTRLVFLLFSLSLVYSFWFFNIHPNLGFDISYLYVPIVEGFPMPWAWSSMMIGDGMGGPVSSTLWVYFNQLYTQILLLVGVPYWLVLKWFLMFPLLLIAVFGVFKLARWYKIDPYIASFFYVTNSYFLVIVDGGQLNLAFAYSMIPLCVWLFIGAIFGGFVRQILFALSVCFLGIWDLRINYILAIILGMYVVFEFFNEKYVFEEKKKFLKEVLATSVITFVLFLLINFYWIFPSLIGGLISLPAGYDKPSQVDFLSFSSLTHALFLQQPHWYLNNFGQIQSPLWYFGIYPVTAFLALLLSRKNKFILLWSMIGLIGIFLTKGSQSPFGTVYLWLFDNIPGFSLFRDPSKFYLLISISYTILIGYVAAVIYIKTRWIYYLLFIAMLFILLPTYTNQMTGSFARQINENDYFELAGKLDTDKTFFRTFWISTKPALGYNSSIHPSTESFWLGQKRPFKTNIIGEYETNNFIRSSAAFQLFDIAGIRYIFYPQLDSRKSSVSRDDVEYYEHFNNWFKTHSDLKEYVGGISGYELPSYSDHIYSIHDLLWIIGGDDTYSYLSGKTPIKLRDIGIVHVNESDNLLNNIERFKSMNNTIVLNKTTQLDLMMAELNSKDLINPSKYVRFEGDGNGWWSRSSSEYSFIKNYLLERYGVSNHDFDLGQGFVISEGSNIFSIEAPKNGRLFIRALESSAGGKLVVSNVDVTTYGEDNTYKWFDAGKVEKKEQIQIQSQGSINIVNALAILDDNQLFVLDKKLIRLNSEYNILNIDELVINPQKQQSIQYVQVNPSKYQVIINNAPTTLMFSETFDPRWKLSLNGKKIDPVLMYSFINAFPILENGVYMLEYEPQRIVNYTLTITFASVLTILFLIGGVIIMKKRRL